MQLWEEYQRYMRRRETKKRAESTRKHAYALVMFALTTPPAPTTTKRAATHWAKKALLRAAELEE